MPVRNAKSRCCTTDFAFFGRQTMLLVASTAFQTVASTRVGFLHHASDPFQMLPVLSPFARSWAFPSSNYYDDSVPLELSSRRESQVP